MTKIDFMEMFYNVMEHNKNVFNRDIPAIRMEFHQMKDSWHRSGSLTDNQVQNWIITKREYAKIKRITNG